MINCEWPHDLITTSEVPTHIHHSGNLEVLIHWYSLKYDHALKFHCHFQLYVLTFTKHMEFLERITKTMPDVFSHFQPKDMLNF